MTRRDRQRRALVTLDDRLVAFEEELRDARRVPGLPRPVREALDELLLDVGPPSGDHRGVAEGWVQCVEPRSDSSSTRAREDTSANAHTWSRLALSPGQGETQDVTQLLPVVRHVVGMALEGHVPEEWHDALVGRGFPTSTCKSVVAAVRLALVEFQDEGDPEGDRDVLNEEEILALLVSKKIPLDIAEVVVDSFLEASC